MKKKLITRKRHLFGFLICAFIICFLIGCTQKDAPTPIEVTDTTEPEGTLKVHFIVTSDVIKVEDFVEDTKDSSEFTEGFRRIELIFDEVKTRELLVKEIGSQVIMEVRFDMDQIFETEYSADTHLWTEKNVGNEGLETEIKPKEDGVYSMELVAVDVYGNASIAKVYALVDTKESIFTLAEDTEIEDQDAGNTAFEEQTIKVKEDKSSAPAKSEESQKEAQARAVAQQIADNVSGSTDLERIRNAAECVAEYCRSATYTTEDPDYRTAYGVFCKGVYTCAGATRAMGLVLDCMGYQWEHVNPNQWDHQWCKVTMDGQTGWADGQTGADYGEHPYTYGGTYTDSEGTVWSW